MQRRFRQVPTFGRDTIRKFGGSVSAMKKLAARDFEDILQVSALPTFLQILLLRHVTSLFSVGSWFLKVFYLVNTTRSYLTLRSTWQHGMPTQNSGCTHPTQSTPFDHRQRNSAVNFVVMPTKCVLNTRRNRCQERLPPVIAVKLQ